VTKNAVISGPGYKKSVRSPLLIPPVAVVDPRLTMSVPPAVKAACGMDALTHSVEAYTCLSKNPISDAYALEAIALIANNILNVVKNPTDQEGRLALATAATLAGMAFSNSMVGMVHTLGHSVGAICHVPHGTCMSILLPYGLEYNMHKNGEYTGELLYALAGEKVYARTPKDQRAKKTQPQGSIT